MAEGGDIEESLYQMILLFVLEWNHYIKGCITLNVYDTKEEITKQIILHVIRFSMNISGEILFSTLYKS